MSDYPNSDEEFEFNYGAELDLPLPHQDEDSPYEPPSKSRKSLDFNTPQNGMSSQTLTTCNNRSFENDFATLNETIVTNNLTENNTETNSIAHEHEQVEQNETSIIGRKRTINELIDEIDNILSDDNPTLPKKQKHVKTELEVIEQIIEMRKLASKRNAIAYFGKDHTKKATEQINNISKRVPKFPFIRITTHNNEKIYVRYHSEEYEKNEMSSIIKDAKQSSFAGVMGESFKDIWNETNALINKEIETNINSAEADITRPSEDNTQLWVDLYKPNSYLDLLSDESINRLLLKWIKLWDQVVFKRKPKQNCNNQNSKIFLKWKNEIKLNVQGDKRPEYKIVLLRGRPGLGKTTLAHIIAEQAGYNVIEINASDDRSKDCFETVLENSSQMSSFLTSDQRPKCIIFDEIDGAPPASVEYLVKFANGTLPVTKPKKGNVKQKPKVLNRPVICICNNVYAPALRPLRQHALVVEFPSTDSTRLARRLFEIAKRQGIKTDLGALRALCEKTNNDIRTCLSVLYFCRAQKKLSLTDVHKSSIGLKDKQKELFGVWQDVFRIEHKKMNATSVAIKDDMNQKLRADKVLSTVMAFGDYEKLSKGVFENYINVMDKTSIIKESTCDALEWFSFNDILNKKIHSQQSHELLCYLPYAFVNWHFAFAKTSYVRLEFPTADKEAREKLKKTKAITGEVLKGMPPFLRIHSTPMSLIFDTLPLLSKLLKPKFRPVNFNLFTPEEKKAYFNVVSIMIDYNLSYVQERKLDGQYTFNLDPNIDEVTSFSGLKPKPKLFNNVCQILAREIDIEKMRRYNNVPKLQAKPSNNNEETESVPNHLRILKAKTIKNKKEAIPCKDFFGRPIEKQDDAGKSTDNKNCNNIWFSYKEGYSNAVRKTITVSSLK